MAQKPPYLFLRGNVYWYSFNVANRRYRGSTGATDLEEATRVAIAARSKVKAGLGALGSPVKVTPKQRPQHRAKALFDDYRERRLKFRGATSGQAHDLYAGRFLEFFGDVVLSKVTNRDVERWRDWLVEQPIRGALWKTKVKRLSAKTVREHIRWLSTVSKFHGLPNPATGVVLPSLTKEQTLDETVKFYSEEELARVLEASKGSSAENAILILLNTGCRPAELLNLHNTPNEIDRENRIVRFIDKRKRVRGLQLVGDPFEKAWQAIIKQAEGVAEGELLFPFSDNWLLKRWHAILKVAGLTPCRPHQLRHQWVRTMFLSGRSIEWCAKWAGHTSMTAFERYSKLLVVPASQGNAGALKPDTAEDLIKRLGSLSVEERREIRRALMPALARRQEREEQEQRDAFEDLLRDRWALKRELERTYGLLDEHRIAFERRIDLALFPNPNGS